MLRVEDAIDMIVDWHKAVAGGASARSVTIDQIHKFLSSNRVTTRKAA